MSASAPIADSRLRRAFGGQARHSPPQRTGQVRIGASRLRVSISQRDFAISRRTIMNNAGSFVDPPTSKLYWSPLHSEAWLPLRDTPR